MIATKFQQFIKSPCGLHDDESQKKERTRSDERREQRPNKDFDFQDLFGRIMSHNMEHLHHEGLLTSLNLLENRCGGGVARKTL